MEPGGRLDALARDLAGGRLSRRGALKRLTGAAATAMLPSFLLADQAFARCPPSRRCGSKCCPPGTRCKRGKCRCRGGLTKCGKKCFDLSTDPASCGSCGHVCPAGQTCVNGQCTGGPTNPTTPVCGDGKAEGAEQCDGADLKGATCASLGLGGGTLACGSGCTYDASGCAQQPVCGNGVREGGEACDGNDHAGKTCQSFGFQSGALVCTSSCQFDTSNCTSGGGCVSPADCPPPAACVNGVCGACTDTSQCLAPTVCVNGSCDLILPP